MPFSLTVSDGQEIRQHHVFIPPILSIKWLHFWMHFPGKEGLLYLLEHFNRVIVQQMKITTLFMSLYSSQMLGMTTTSWGKTFGYSLVEIRTVDHLRCPSRYTPVNWHCDLAQVMIQNNFHPIRMYVPHSIFPYRLLIPWHLTRLRTIVSSVISRLWTQEKTSTWHWNSTSSKSKPCLQQHGSKHIVKQCMNTIAKKLAQLQVDGDFNHRSKVICVFVFGDYEFLCWLFGITGHMVRFHHSNCKHNTYSITKEATT